MCSKTTRPSDFSLVKTLTSESLILYVLEGLIDPLDVPYSMPSQTSSTVVLISDSFTTIVVFKSCLGVPLCKLPILIFCSFTFK